MSKNRLTPTKESLNRLFAKSGNRCAFKECSNLLFTDKNIFIGQVCHIKAVSNNGERFDSTLTPEDLRKPENLMLLCYEHHVEIDRGTKKYSTTELLEAKREHEKQFEKSTQDLTHEQANQIVESYFKTFNFKLDSIIVQNNQDAHLKKSIEYQIDPLSKTKWSRRAVIRNAFIGILSLSFLLLVSFLDLLQGFNLFLYLIIYGLLIFTTLACSPMIFAITWIRNEEIDFLGTFYNINDNSELISYQKYARCNFPNCNGLVKIIEPPEKEAKRHKNIGCCSKEPRLHTFSCENNYKIGYYYKMDFSKKNDKSNT